GGAGRPKPGARLLPPTMPSRAPDRPARPAVTRLSVNLNKVALLRNSRGGGEPDIVRAATACLDAGADGLTLHPRPDGRHARTDDVLALAALCRERGVEFNLEGNPFAPPRAGYPGFLALCERAQPHQATLVPDGDDQLTSDHGFDFRSEEHTSELQSRENLVCRLLLEKKKKKNRSGIQRTT